MSSVLVVGAHPDDEAVGCGGALLCHARAGDRISAVFLTSGEAGGHGIENAGARREREAQTASRVLGIESVQFWREPDGRLRARRELIARLRAALAETRATVVYAPHPRDDHPDHRAAARIVREALAGTEPGPVLWHYEIWCPLSQIDHVVDISDVLERKLRAICAYESQCAVMRFDDAFRGLARYRGEMHSWPGGPYAEVFTSGNGA